jgi:hypothetical protein
MTTLGYKACVLTTFYVQNHTVTKRLNWIQNLNTTAIVAFSNQVQLIFKKLSYLLYVFHFIFLVVLGFELKAYTLSHSTAHFCFQDRVLETICLGWLQRMILLISGSWVVRITDMSHWCLAKKVILNNLKVATINLLKILNKIHILKK